MLYCQDVKRLADWISPTRPADCAAQIQSTWIRSAVQAPVDSVEEQVGQREGQAWVRVDHVAVVHQQLHVLPHRPLPPQTHPLRRPRVQVRARGCKGVGGQCRRHPRKGGQLYIVVMETAIKGHGLAGVEGGGDLKGARNYLFYEIKISNYQNFWVIHNYMMWSY